MHCSKAFSLVSSSLPLSLSLFHTTMLRESHCICCVRHFASPLLFSYSVWFAVC